MGAVGENRRGERGNSEGQRGPHLSSPRFPQISQTWKGLGVDPLTSRQLDQTFTGNPRSPYCFSKILFFLPDATAGSVLNRQKDQKNRGLLG